MDAFLVIGLLILVFVGIPIGIGFVLYFVPKRFGHPKASKYLTIGYSLIVLTITFFIVFEDQFFKKGDANKLVTEQGFVLKDDFQLVDNETTSAIGDYYHTFTLEISETDKMKAISEIKNSQNFQSGGGSFDHMLYLSDKRYFGTKVTQNYETDFAFVREYFEPSGRKGYAPTFRRISISKTKNELIFEDIDD
ncbi:hypothetical protein WG947_10290 [Pontibacter sp. H259]|uniref:hypothetical protein n=1 Tax=Pontibacter sp. H259 TaxID=3133421 RepID=UPI0030BF369F